MPRSKPLPTVAAVAAHFEVSETSVHSAKRRFADFPAKGAKGFSVAAVDTFCRRNKLWHHRPAKPATGGNDELRAAQLAKTREQARLLKIQRENAAVEQSLRIGELVLAADVAKFYSETCATVRAVLDTAADALDRSLPEHLPTNEKQYQSARARAMKVGETLTSQCSAAMIALQKGADDE